MKAVPVLVPVAFPSTCIRVHLRSKIFRVFLHGYAPRGGPMAAHIRSVAGSTPAAATKIFLPEFSIHSEFHHATFVNPA